MSKLRDEDSTEEIRESDAGSSQSDKNNIPLTPDDVADYIERSGLKGDEAVMILQSAAAICAKRASMNEAKITSGGALGEMIVCKQLALTFNSATKNGHDAKTADGKCAEIKTISVSINSKSKMNVNYALPERGAKESGASYIESVAAAKKNPAGHYWAIVNLRDRSVVQHWHFDDSFIQMCLAKKVEVLLKEDAARRTFKINFGAVYCKKHGTIHRIEELKKLEAQFLSGGQVNWKLLEARVSARH